MPSSQANNINQNGASSSSVSGGSGSGSGSTSRSTDASNTQNVSTSGTNNSSNRTSDARRLRDPFLFYSDNRNLSRARHFENVDYSNQEVGNEVQRRTRISFEVDAVTLMADLFLNDVGGAED